jgi:hypothetical protein
MRFNTLPEGPCSRSDDKRYAILGYGRLESSSMYSPALMAWALASFRRAQRVTPHWAFSIRPTCRAVRPLMSLYRSPFSLRRAAIAAPYVLLKACVWSLAFRCAVSSTAYSNCSQPRWISPLGQ